MQAILSKKKTEVHGLKSRRWTVYDKIIQYNGLIKLYNRDKKIFNADTKKDQHKLKKQILNLRHEIEHQRTKLDNAIKGDRQRLRNTLSEDQSLLLAYQNMHPTKVVEVLYQANFNKKKYLDRIRHRIKEKTQELVHLKLMYADFEDRIKYEKKDKIPIEETAQIITAKVEDAVMKNDTALDVQNTYKNILNVLKKDSIYFDAVLRALQIDGFKQGRCLLKITEMGQLATEYLDDRREEYYMLETILKASMAEREKSINDIKQQIENLHNNVKNLIRRDSVILMDEDRKSVTTSSELMLRQDIEGIVHTLNTIKDITLVSKIEHIFPRFEEQERQKNRLENLVEKNIKDRNTLMNKSHHAEEMYNTLSHSMVETTLWYKEEKERLLTELKEVEERSDKTVKLIICRGEMFVNIRTCLQEIAEILRNEKLPDGKKDTQRKGTPRGKATPKSPKGSPRSPKTSPRSPKTSPRSQKSTPRKRHDKKILPQKVAPERCEENAKELINQITKKLQVLLREAASSPYTEVASRYYESFVSRMVHTNVIDTTVKEEALIDDSLFDDPQVPSRAEVKRISAEICEKNAKTEFDV